MVMMRLAALLIVSILAGGQTSELEGDECSKGPRSPPQCRWFYLAYAPRMLRAGVDERVLVTTSNVNFEVKITASLRDAKDSDKVLSSGFAIVQPGVLAGIVLKVPFNAPSSGTIKIEGEANVSAALSGVGRNILWKFENVTKSLSIQKTGRTMFIQTDRPIYKPGEAMRMRIVVVDSNLKAVTGKISRITVMNPQKTLLRQWRNVELHNGVANLKLKFSIKPVLGKWKVQAYMSGLSKTIEVKVEKYVLPKFQVKIKPPSYIALGQSKVFGDVCAKYSYGKDVNGFMTAKVCALIPGYWRRRWNKPKKVCQAILKKIFGCAPFDIDLHSFGVYNYSGYGTIKFSIDASVKERATGLSLNATSVKKSIAKTDIKLSFAGTPGIFKPGLPFEAVLLVTRPDGSLADDVKVKVEVNSGWSKTLFKKDLIVNNGRVKIDLPKIPFNSKTLRFSAYYVRPQVHGSRISEWKRRTSTYHNAKPWYSPTHSYLGIDKPKKIFKVGEEAVINVRYTVGDSYPTSRTVYYTLMCKGYAAHFGSVDKEFLGFLSKESVDEVDEIATTVELPTESPIEDLDGEINSTAPQTNPPTTSPTAPPTTPTTTAPYIGPHGWWREEARATRPPLPKGFTAGSFQVKFNVTQDMSPSCRMLVYYMRQRETVADSRVIDIEDSFANKVSMKFSEEEVFPGAKVKLSLKASPGSMFAISAVDKSVHFMGNANDISRGGIINILENLDIGPGYIDESSRCRQGWDHWWYYYSSSDFVDSQKAFNDNGMVFISNLLVDSRPCESVEPMAMPFIADGEASMEFSAPMSGSSDLIVDARPCEAMEMQPESTIDEMDEDANVTSVLPLLSDALHASPDCGVVFLTNLVADSRPCGTRTPRRRLGSGSFRRISSRRRRFAARRRAKDGGVIFLSNLFIDSRPCGRYGRIAFLRPPAGSVDEDVDAPLLPEGAASGTAGPNPVFRGKDNKKPQPKPKKPVRKPPRKQIRSDFRETWLWTEEQFDAKTGEKTIDVKVPDTITTWHASGFAISANDGLGVANPAEIKGFKALFVSVNLPYAVTRGELVTIPVVAFNYLSECLNVRISMKDSKEIKPITRGYMNTCICGGRTATVMFKAYARVLGRIQIEAKVESMPKNNCPSFVKFDGSSYIDIVRKKLLVEPEGVEKEYTYNSLVCPKGNEVQDNVKLAIPDKVVDGSVFSELRVIGDLMGPSLANIDGLLKMPYGCGEQNMLNFAPNIFIMQYLQATGQLTDEIKQKATDYTLQGYQRELTYKHSDGAYSAFGESDKEGSMWLTAFVLKSFAQARDFIEIDSKVLGAAKRWILGKQTSDGCFPSVGSLHNKAMKGGVKSPITLTGYVVVALLEADMRPENPHIRKAIKDCIKPDLDKVSDTYSLNILAYTMSKAGYTKELGYLLTKLDISAIKEDGNRYWGEPKKPEKPRDNWFYAPYTQAKSTDIEQTAYGLMASIEKDKSKAVENIDIVRWLSQQRNSLGGWASTQDTVLAMQALAAFSAIVHGGKQDLTIDVAVPGMSHKFTINDDNKLVLQRLEIPPKFPALLKTYARGQGCALLSASVKYNVKDVQEEPAFMLDVNLSPLLGKEKDVKFGRCHSQEIDICAKWLREDSSNMAIISVKMLSGFEPIIETLEKAKSRDKSLKDFEKNGKAYDFYYNKITKKGVCLRFKMKQKQIVQNIQPSLVRVYDYYDTDLKATKMYKVTPAQCAGIATPNP